MEKILSTIVSEAYARKNIVFPKAIDKEKIYVLMESYDIDKVNDIKKFSGRQVRVIKSTKEKILGLIDKNYETNTSVTDMDIDIDYDRILSEMIEKAIFSGASDIHIEPFSSEVRVRYRINGDLILVDRMVTEDLYKLGTLIKLKGLCDITEKRIPQDGRFRYENNGFLIDIRVSTLPTIYGEKLVMRLLDHSNFIKDIRELGFSVKSVDKIEKILEKPCGMLIVTGSTGSGKSSTVYSILNKLKDRNINITTIEDPVEYKIDGINQIQVNSKSGMTFEKGLRSILRQDPDCIVLGEVRDKESADLAIRSAITGHFVITTLHTNDGIATISRLKDMGIEPYMINASLVGVISQRLVKKRMLVDNYTGDDRTLIYELLEIGPEIREGIKIGLDDTELRRIAIANGMITYEDSIEEKNIN